MLTNIMPMNIGISIFLGFFMGATGIYTARALAHCLRTIYNGVNEMIADSAPVPGKPGIDLGEWQ